MTSLLLLSPKFSLRLRHLSSAERAPPLDTALSKFPVVPFKCLVGMEARCPALLPSHSFPRSLQQISLGKKTNTRMKYLRNLKSNENGNVYNLFRLKNRISICDITYRSKFMFQFKPCVHPIVDDRIDHCICHCQPIE